MNFSKQLFTHRALAVGLLLAPAVALGACSETPPETTTPEAATDNIEVEEVATETATLIGETVSVRAEVLETVGETSLLLDDEKLFGGEDVLVINASNEPFVLTDDDNQVQVTGEVQQLVIADFEQSYGVALDPTIYADYEERPVIVAQSIALSPDPIDITDNPNEYFSRRLAVAGEIENQLSPTTFTLSDEQLFGGEDLLVLTQMPAPLAQEGERVTVTGVLRPFVAAEFERDYDLDWDLTLQEDIEAEFTGRPALVVDEVYPSAE